jgi:hypothetical protein
LSSKYKPDFTHAYGVIRPDTLCHWLAATEGMKHPLTFNGGSVKITGLDRLHA